MTKPLEACSTAELGDYLENSRARYAEFARRGLKLDVTRGKPSSAQLDLSNALLDSRAFMSRDNADCRNYYGGVHGLPEARELFAPMLGAPAAQVIVADNTSLGLMHDALVYSLLSEGPEREKSWLSASSSDVKFLCPVPGYDRHFALCERLGIKMIPVNLTGHGPDLDEVERYVEDPSVKGIWCVPKYSNPTGETYSEQTVRGLAAMNAAATDFRIFWDNAYCEHHLGEDEAVLPDIIAACTAAGHSNRAFVFGSTSKMTFPGGGLALFASSAANVDWFARNMSVRTIGPDKLNQLRHVELLRDHDGIKRHMVAHRAILQPKFQAVTESFERELAGTGAKWSEPKGGYFVCLNVLPGTARRTVALARAAGIAMVPAGATHPYGRDQLDSTLRIAPSFPSVEDVRFAAEGIAISVQVATAESLLAS